MVTFILYFLKLLILLVITFFIGNLSIRFLTKQIINGFFTNLYVSLLAGSLLEVLLIALFYTGGKTNLILAIPIIIYFVINFRTRTGQETPNNNSFQIFRKPEILKFSLTLLTFLAFFFILEFLFIFDFGNNSFLPQTTLFSFYSYISEYIVLNGHENIFHIFNHLDSDYQGVTPYHYYELWTNALINTTLSGISVANLLTITYPFYYFMAFTGILAIQEFFNKNITIKDIVIAGLLLFTAGVFLNFYDSIPLLTSAAEYSKIIAFGENRKLASIYAFIPVIFLLYLQNKNKYILIFCLLLPLHNVILFPPVIGGILLILVLNLFLKREKLLTESLIVIFFIITFGLFYTLFASKINVNQDESFNVLTQLLDTAKLKTRINILLGSVVYSGIVYFLAIVGFIFVVRKKAIVLVKPYLPLLLFFLFISFSGLITWALLFELNDSNQFFTQIHGLLFNFVLIFFFIIVYYYTSPKFNFSNFSKIALLLLFTAINIYNLTRVLAVNKQATMYGKYNFNRGFLNQVETLVNNGQIKGVGGYMKNKKEFSGDVGPMNPLFSLKGMYFPVIKPELIAISLDHDFPVKADPLIRKREEQVLKFSAFLKFVDQQKAAGTFLNIEQSQVDFINKHDLKFIILSEGVTPSDKLNALVKNKITDPASKETILLLK